MMFRCIDLTNCVSKVQPFASLGSLWFTTGFWSESEKSSRVLRKHL